MKKKTVWDYVLIAYLIGGIVIGIIQLNDKLKS